MEVKNGDFMNINIAEIAYNTGMILLVFVGALVITKTIAKYANKKK